MPLIMATIILSHGHLVKFTYDMISRSTISIPHHVKLI
jgi:hypothetical protein